MIHEAIQVLDLAEFILICKIAFDVGKYKTKLEGLITELSKRVEGVEEKLERVAKRKHNKKQAGGLKTLCENTF